MNEKEFNYHIKEISAQLSTLLLSLTNPILFFRRKAISDKIIESILTTSELIAEYKINAKND